jgi:Protein of unknown function (DUF3631)
MALLPSAFLRGAVTGVFERSSYEAFRTSDLINELSAVEEAPWGDWYGKKISPQALSALLRPYRIKTMPVWVDGAKARGYKREQFAEAWERYVPRVQGGRGGRGGRPGFPSQNDLPPPTTPTTLRFKGGRPDPAPEARSTTPTTPTAPHARNGDRPDFPRTEEWLARDGTWHSLEDDPPAFAAEVRDVRTAGVAEVRLLGEPGYLDRLYAALKDGWITASEFNEAEREHALIRDHGGGEPTGRRTT